jgi:hypothetical protein
MTQNITSHKKKEFISKPMKFAIAAASIAGTLGLWGIFSNADMQNTTVQASTGDVIPTVATLVSVNASSVAAPSASVDTSSNSVSSLDSLPVVTQPPVVAAATAAPVIIQQPAPVTSSHSSRP